MSVGQTWMIAGVSEETRRAAQEAAQAAGLSLGEWVDRTLAEGALRTVDGATSPAVDQDATQAARRLLAKRRSAETDQGLSPIEAMRARMRRRRTP